MTAARKLPFPDRAMQMSGTIFGTRGSGKSSTARSLFEHELDQGHRCGFIDPMGDAAGIRLTPEGKPSRFARPPEAGGVLIFGGPHGDLPITDEDGAKVGSFVAAYPISFLVDLSGMIEAEQHRFMTGFADVLYDQMKVPLLLLVDEAHVFAPQQTRDAPSKLLNRMIRLNTQGRKRGIFLWLMTQRPARINKNIISGTETLIAMRVTMPRDIDTIGEWLEMHDPVHAADVKGNLARLKTGEAFVSVPTAEFFERITIPMHSTMDTGRTPQHGETIGGVEIPKMDVGALAKAFGATSTADPRDDEIAQLREQLRGAGERVDHARKERVTAVQQRDVAIEVLAKVQDVIGMAIGSPMIIAADPEFDPDEVMMILEGDGVVRPHTRDTIAVEKIKGGRRRMADAAKPKRSGR